jgi:hypothetical protein
MSIKSNGGDTSTGPRILTGTWTFTVPAQWDATSINYYTGDAYGPYNWVDIGFENYGTQYNGFKSTPVITATIKGTSGLGLIPRIASSGSYTATQGFRLALYNPSSSTYTLGSNIVVNWIAVENTNRAG